MEWLDVINFLKDTGVDAYYLPIMDKSKVFLGTLFLIMTAIASITKTDKDDTFWKKIKGIFFRTNNNEGEEK